MNGRAAIFDRLKKSLAVPENDAERRETVRRRLQDAPAGLIPQRAQLPEAERIDLFCRMAESVQATVERVASAEAVPQAVVSLLRARNLPASVRMGDDPRLAAMPWAETSALEVLKGRSHGADEVTVSHAFAGVAETGTLVLHAGADNPTTLNFLPETHVAVISAKDIAGDMEEAWTRLRAKFGKGVMPRVVNMVTGPSRSADIEQKLILGAHGPRALHIIVIDDG